jgi:DNA-directed RNA polymerase specialized sigma24 family protein
MKKLTPEQRMEIAQKAAAGRWARWRARQYAPLVPPKDVRERRLKVLQDQWPRDAHLFKRVALDGVAPGEMAKLQNISEAEVLQRVHKIIEKLNHQ